MLVLFNPAFMRFFSLSASLSGSMFIVVTERVRTAEFGTIHCSLQGRMAGCSTGDFVEREAALSRTVAARAEGADPTSLILGWPEDGSGASSPYRFQSPSLGKQKYMGQTCQESARPHLFQYFCIV